MRGSSAASAMSTSPLTITTNTAVTITMPWIIR